MCSSNTIAACCLGSISMAKLRMVGWVRAAQSAPGTSPPAAVDRAASVQCQTGQAADGSSASLQARHTAWQRRRSRRLSRGSGRRSQYSMLSPSCSQAVTFLATYSEKMCRSSSGGRRAAAGLPLALPPTSPPPLLHSKCARAGGVGAVCWGRAAAGRARRQWRRVCLCVLAFSPEVGPAVVAHDRNLRGGAVPDGDLACRTNLFRRDQTAPLALCLPV